MISDTTTSNCISTSNDNILKKSKVVAKKNNIKKRKSIDSSEEDEDSSSSTSSSSEGENSVNSKNSDESLHEMMDYAHLVNTLHYDPKEKCMYKSTRVVEKEGFIVVFRKRQFKDGR